MNDAVVSESAEARHLGPDNPWPGLDAFDEAGRDFFHGRDGEAEELLHRVASAPMTVLFGRSGLGKTSLLKAGLFPRLRQRRFPSAGGRSGGWALRHPAATSRFAPSTKSTSRRCWSAGFHPTTWSA